MLLIFDLQSCPAFAATWPQTVGECLPTEAAAAELYVACFWLQSVPGNRRDPANRSQINNLRKTVLCKEITIACIAFLSN